MNATAAWIVDLAIIGIFAMGFIAFFLGGVVGFLHRSYAGERVPFYAPIIVGLGAVGLWLNTASALILFISGVGEEAAEPVVLGQIELNVATAIVGGFAAYAGGRAGDHMAPTVQVMAHSRPARTDMSTLVKSAGRIIRVTIPPTIATIDGHDPVTDDTKARLTGAEFVFPRGLTVHELRERIVQRLREDYHVGFVDIEINDEGAITYLALGRRVAGIGPTLPPNRVAIAVTANPPPAASPGDVVQLWELPAGEDEVSEPGDSEVVEPADRAATADADLALPPELPAHPDRWYRPHSDRFAFAVRTPDGARRYATDAEAAAALIRRFYPTDASVPDVATFVTTGELRAKVGDVATVTVEERAIVDIDQTREYRLVTVPASKQPEQEFAELLRAANEHMESIVISPHADLIGIPVGAIRPSILSIRTSDGDVITLPARTYCCAPGDQLYAIGRPDHLRKLHDAATSEV